MFVDSLIALCSTSYPQAKHVVNSSFEACSEQISKVGFSLMLQAVVREDAKYLQDEGEMDEEDEEDQEGDEEGLENGAPAEEQSEGEERKEEEAMLGKRKHKSNGKEQAIEKPAEAKQAKAKSRVEN